MSLLKVTDLEVSYGGIDALRGISFDVEEGEIVTLIGANGAGKTTTLHAISGLLKPKSGEITFCGNNLAAMEAHKIIGLGLAQVPDGLYMTAGTLRAKARSGSFPRALRWYRRGGGCSTI